MNQSKPTLNEKVTEIVSADFEFAFDLENGRRNKDRLRGAQVFIKYLVSVATHPICLNSSTNPYNCSQEHMLAYIMDTFSLTDTHIRKILMGKAQVDNLSDVIDLSNTVNPKKRHSWRPELRIRINAPKFFNQKNSIIENLNVRVYIYENGQKTDMEKSGVNNSNFKFIDTKGKKILHVIFRQLKTKPPSRIKSSGKLHSLVKFQPSTLQSTVNSLSISSYKMVQSTDGHRKTSDDIYLNIRRYYCEPKTAHRLRFEFWLDPRRNISPLRRAFGNLINGCISCTCSRCLRETQSSINTREDFYGYVDFNLDQMPSYAIKRNVPILSASDIKVNSCEIILEPRNRRILDSEDDYSETNTEASDKPKKSIEEFIVNHIRLYANCLLHQAIVFEKSISRSKLKQTLMFQNISLDNILYLPAYTLLNQHRVQSNLTWFEDQCLRRVAMLLLLNKLARSDTTSSILKIQVMLTSVIQNEYLLTNKQVDVNTREEVDPFKDGTTFNANTFTIVKMELQVLREFIESALSVRLANWLTIRGDKNDKVEKSLTLAGLKLCKFALNYFRKTVKANLSLSGTNHEITAMKSRIEQILCDVILGLIKMRLIGLVEKEAKLKEKAKVRFKDQVEKRGQSLEFSWLGLVQDLRLINDDLCLNWSRNGLNGLVIGQQGYVKNLNLSSSLDGDRLRRSLKSKIDDFVG